MPPRKRPLPDSPVESSSIRRVVFLDLSRSFLRQRANRKHPGVSACQFAAFGSHSPSNNYDAMVPQVIGPLKLRGRARTALEHAISGLTCTTAVHICYGYGIQANLDWKKTLGDEWRQYEAIFPAIAKSKRHPGATGCALCRRVSPSSASTHRSWRKHHPSASPAHSRSTGQSPGTARQPARS